ncbi:MAG: helix-turn-helix domain-containing protein [Azoarcus sp.]|nr:helix-turn-helix domain-containing protein [Azoarcus sp.]|tara:strand:+ start:3795 stop:4220 length:426 start_codon:yes stop_codon:yes gene_type:complete
MSTRTFTVGQLAQATGTRAVTIRYYERIGLLPSAARNASGYRVYTAQERDRLRFVRRSRALGFSLEDIRDLLELADHRRSSCAAVDAKITQKLEQVRQSICDMQGLEQELERLSSCCQGGVIEECRIIESLGYEPGDGHRR